MVGFLKVVQMRGLMERWRFRKKSFQCRATFGLVLMGDRKRAFFSLVFVFLSKYGRYVVDKMVLSSVCTYIMFASSALGPP